MMVGLLAQIWAWHSCPGELEQQLAQRRPPGGEDVQGYPEAVVLYAFESRGEGELTVAGTCLLCIYV
jgi:hypothetical protein